MIHSKILLAFLILLAAAQFCFGQEKPKAVLADEFGYANCEEMQARMDSFFQELMADPSSMGYVVIYPRKGKPNAGLSIEKNVKGFIYFRNFDKTRITIARGVEMPGARVHFWRVPAGADKPEFTESEWAMPRRDLSKAFIFSTISSVDNICPTFAPGDYIDLLTANPDLRGHIVIFNRSKKEGRKEADKWLKTFTEDGKIDRSRFKVFFSKNEGIPDAEFWVVPVKKK